MFEINYLGSKEVIIGYPEGLKFRIFDQGDKIIVYGPDLLTPIRVISYPTEFGSFCINSESYLFYKDLCAQIENENKEEG